jgi:hypothetical protein
MPSLLRRMASLLGNRPINLVITLDRKDENFARFYQSLFQMMFAGTSMPMAWVRLAPQLGPQPPNLPEMWCQMGAGQVAFAN